MRTPGNTLVVQSSKPYQVTQVTGFCALLAVGPGSKRCRAELRASLAACNTAADAAESCCTTITPLVFPCASLVI